MHDRIQKYPDISKQPVLRTDSVQCTLPTFARLFTQIKGERRKIKLMSGTAGDGFRVGTFFFLLDVIFLSVCTSQHVIDMNK